MANDPTYDALTRLRVPLYLFAALLIINSGGDFLANVWPLRFGDVEWRYGVTGLLSGFLLTPIFGLAIALTVAAIVGDRVLLKVLGWLAMTSGVLLFVLTGMFALDIAQFRAAVPVEGQGQYDIGSWKAVAKHLATVPVLIIFGRASLLSARSLARH